MLIWTVARQIFYFTWHKLGFIAVFETVYFFQSSHNFLMMLKRKVTKVFLMSHSWHIDGSVFGIDSFLAISSHIPYLAAFFSLINWWSKFWALKETNINKKSQVSVYLLVRERQKTVTSKLLKKTKKQHINWNLKW